MGWPIAAQHYDVSFIVKSPWRAERVHHGKVMSYSYHTNMYRRKQTGGKSVSTNTKILIPALIPNPLLSPSLVAYTGLFMKKGEEMSELF